MEIEKLSVNIKVNYPKNGELPEYDGSYYVVTIHNDHRIMKYQKDNHVGYKWFGTCGEWDKLNNESVKCWTNLLPIQ